MATATTMPMPLDDDYVYYNEGEGVERREKPTFKSPTIPVAKLFASTSGKQKQRQTYNDIHVPSPQDYDPYTPPDGFPFPSTMPDPDRARSVPPERTKSRRSSSSQSNPDSGRGSSGDGAPNRKHSLSKAYSRLVGRSGGGGPTLADYVANPDPASTESQSHHHHHHHHSQTHSHSQPHNSYPNTRSRSYRSKSPESVNALLVLTTERLGQETSRANAAERLNAETLAHLRTAVQDKRRLESELSRANKELALYKTQLELAQNEINRAQEYTNRMQEQLTEAEERASRDRDRLRKLVEERVTTIAREEGYRQGLEEARRMQWSERERPTEFVYRRPREREQERLEGERDDGRMTMDEPVSPVSSSSSNGRSRAESIRSYFRPRSRSRVPSRSGPPDVAPMAAPPPMPTVATPTSVRVPSTQPQPTRPRPRPTPDPAPINSPESISVRQGSSVNLGGSTMNLHGRSTTNLDDTRSEFHPVPVYNRSPAMSHRSIVVPPEGYIPTVGVDSTFTLPPPHEMGGTMAATSEAGDRDDREPSVRARDFAYGEGPARPRSSMSRPVNAPPIAMATSVASTRISQYDLVSPPRERDISRNNAGTPTPIPGRARSRTQPEQIADNWRTSNTFRSQTPGASSSRRPQFIVRNGSGIERPATTEPTNPDKMPRSPRVSGGPRLPRQIIPPVPLGNVVTVNSLHHIDVPHYGSKQPYPPRSPPGPSPEQQERKSSTDSNSSTRSNNSNSSGYSNRTRSPIGWLRSRFQNSRTVTGTTIPNIDVEPPSQSPTTASGRTTMVDPVLLSPDHANHSMNLSPVEPSSASQSQNQTPARDGFLGLYSRPPSRSAGGNADAPITGVITDTSQLPPGFVPLSPIPSVSNMNIYGGFEPIANSNSSPSVSPQGSGAGNFGRGGGIYADPVSRPATAMGTGCPPNQSGAGTGTHRRNMSYGGIYSPAPLDLNISAFQ